MISTADIKRTWQAIGLAMIALVVYLSVTPDIFTLPGEDGDKMGHALAYGVLMAWFAQIEHGRNARIAYAIGFAALAIGLEFVQGALSYRTFDIRDMVSGVFGIALGWISAPPRGPDVYRRVARAVAGN